MGIEAEHTGERIELAFNAAIDHLRLGLEMRHRTATLPR
jgi:hypothetical protein